MAIEKHERQLDGRTQGREWFARPQNTCEILGERRGQIYGQRCPEVIGSVVDASPLPCLIYQQQPTYLVQLDDVFLEGVHGLGSAR